jgi:hypothetical protein
MPVIDPLNPDLNESLSYTVENGMVVLSGMGGVMVAPLDPSVPMSKTPNPYMDRNFILNLYYRLKTQSLTPL